MAQYFRNETQSLPALAGARVRLEYFPSGASLYPPVVGAVISMHFTPSEKGPGHVAILRALESVSATELTGTLFAQHGAIPFAVGAPVPHDTVRFVADEEGRWSGTVKAPLFNSEFRIVGWTNAAVVAP
jgi:hypothetical protein